MEALRYAELELAVTINQKQITDFLREPNIVELLYKSNIHLANQPL